MKTSCTGRTRRTPTTLTLTACATHRNIGRRMEIRKQRSNNRAVRADQPSADFFSYFCFVVFFDVYSEPPWSLTSGQWSVALRVPTFSIAFNAMQFYPSLYPVMSSSLLIHFIHSDLIEIGQLCSHTQAVD